MGFLLNRSSPHPTGPSWSDSSSDLQVIQQGWGAVLRWSGKLSQNLAELAARKEEIRTDLHHLQAGSDFAPVSSGAQVPWALGRLFGAPKSSNSPQGHSLPTRSALNSSENVSIVFSLSIFHIIISYPNVII